MAKYERGVYEPSDEVRVFDGAEDDDDVEGSRLPLLIVLALLVLAMFGGVVWLAYSQGVARGRGETPVLTAAAGPERVAPAQPGGGNVPYQGFKIYEQPAPPDDSADGGAPAANSAPAAKPAAPEVPKPAPQAMTPAPAAPQAAAPKPQVAMAPPAKPAPQPAAPAPQAAKPAPKPAATPQAAGTQANKPNSLAALIQQADTTSATKPAPKAMTPAPVVGPATGAPRQLGQTAAAAPVAAAPKPAASAGGAYVLQIGSYKSQADAQSAWAAYKAKHAALLSGYAPDVKQADLGEKGTWYRLRVAGFGDREVASALCERLKADGGACILAK